MRTLSTRLRAAALAVVAALVVALGVTATPAIASVDDGYLDVRMSHNGTALSNAPIWTDASNLVTIELTFTADGRTVPTDGPYGVSAFTLTGTPGATVIGVTSDGYGRVVVTLYVPTSVQVVLSVEEGALTSSDWSYISPEIRTPELTINRGVAPGSTTTEITSYVNVPLSTSLGITGTPSASVTVLSGALPPGVTLAETGEISGTPTAAGLYAAWATLRNDVGVATVPVTFTILEAPVLTSGATVVVPYNMRKEVTITHTGVAGVTASFAPCLTLGVETVRQTTGSATFALTSTFAGSLTCTLELRDAAGQSVAQIPVTVETVMAPVWSGGNTRTLTVGESATTLAPLVASSIGGAPPVVALQQGSLPPGVSAVPNGSTMTFTGTPTTAGTYSATFRATANDLSTDITVTFTVNPAENISGLPASALVVRNETTEFPFWLRDGFNLTGSVPVWAEIRRVSGENWKLVVTPPTLSDQTITLTAGATTVKIDILPYDRAVIPALGTVQMYVGEPVEKSWTVEGSELALTTSLLPDGLTLTLSGNTLSLTGTPTAVGTTDTAVIVKGRGDVGSSAVTLDVVDHRRVSIDDATVQFGVHTTMPITTTGTLLAGIGAEGLPAGLEIVQSDNGYVIEGTPQEAGQFDVTVTATFGDSPDLEVLSDIATITVTQPPAFSGDDAVSVVAGEVFAIPVTTTGYPTAAISTTTDLPDGVTLTDNGDGTATLSGTISTVSTLTVQLQATNRAGSAQRQLTVKAGITPVITVEGLLPVHEGTPVSFRADIWSTSPASTRIVDAPLGLQTGSGLLGVTFYGIVPRGVHTFSIVAENEFGSTTVPVTLTVGSEPVLNTVPSTQIIVGKAVYIPVSVSGGFPVPTLAAEGLPDGLRLESTGPGQAHIVGTPTVTGSHIVTISATNVFGVSHTEFQLTVAEPPQFVTADHVTLDVDTYDAFYVTTTGFPSASITASTLPSGLALGPSIGGTAIISGTPETPGEYDVTLTAENGTTPVTQTLHITVAAPPAITAPESAVVSTASDADLTVSATGHPLPALTATGLPDGVTFTDNGDGTASFGGRATTGGISSVVVTAENLRGTASAEIALTVNEAPEFITAATITRPAGEDIAAFVATSGFPTATLTATGLPDGLTFTDQGDGSGLISGNAATAGTSAVVITATSAAGTVTQHLALTLTTPTRFTSAAASGFTVGTAGSFTVSTTGFPVAALTAGGSLPTGLTFRDAGDGTATITGTPTEAGVTDVTITATRPGTSLELRALRVAPPEETAVTQTLRITVAAAETEEPEPGESPEPSESVTPEPSESGTPEPSESVTPEPSETGTPEPSESGTPEPSESVTPEPSETVGPTGSASAEPTAAAGTGGAPTTAATPTAAALPATGGRDASGLGLIAVLVAGIGILLVARMRTRRA